ncbi:hypothetical protein SAMN05216480_10339 [Pustulibacterium marinum]|uniref:Uncharacterized protein n=1 Tax=Pustulibacterium marinum TaxID=1224947 RepID=A0A1I7G0V2_9FLAO|nr:hypothetical protein [Pustulibacterium marinum]SFU42063.1 hypothetical protein SAMN05216480_10339 [Pustulibacterium marinum]
METYENQRQLLKSIQSYIELGKTSNLEVLTSKIFDLNLAYYVKYQIEQLNFGLVTRKIDDYLFKSSMDIFLYQRDDIKKFDFDSIENKNLNFIKTQIGINQLFFYKTSFGTKENLRHWDNINRFEVLCNKELVTRIKEYPKLNLCVFKSNEIGEQGNYTRFEILTPRDYIRKTTHYKTEGSREDYHDWYMDAYENDESNFWNND